MPFQYFLRNNLGLYSRGLQDETIKNWEFWRYQTTIDMIQEASKPKDQDELSN